MGYSLKTARNRRKQSLLHEKVSYRTENPVRKSPRMAGGLGGQITRNPRLDEQDFWV